MNIVLTGSIGRIGKPLTQHLVDRGHSVTVISSTADRQPEIEALGATAAIGALEDPYFLTTLFTGADIVYLMEPPFNFFDPTRTVEEAWLEVAESYLQAVRQSGVRNIVHLSSIGGHTDAGIGFLKTHHIVENRLKSLPEEVVIKTMRPVGFYYNMFAFIPAIQHTGAIVQNYGGDQKEPWVSPLDIAAVIVEEMETPFNGRTVRYIASDVFSPNEAAAALGAAIGQPDLRWKVIPDDQFRSNLLQVGFTPQAADGTVEMNQSRLRHLYDDYHQNPPALGTVKLAHFAHNFAVAYHHAAQPSHSH
ncbi:MAG: NAD-dependent epimerase/dehydratase family protein [Sphingobacteriales bacterium]|nr:MAG: NAD-dependent epimerase/dehydratase family protein [Sphingobacteriales bacterium]